MKIRIDNTKAVLKAINTAQHGCSRRCISPTRLVSDIESHPLLQALPETYWRGLSVVYEVGFGGHRPMSYRNTPESTYAVLERGGRAWFLTDVGRGPAPAIDGARVTLGTVTAEQRSRALQTLLNPYRARP